MAQVVFVGRDVAEVSRRDGATGRDLDHLQLIADEVQRQL